MFFNLSNHPVRSWSEPQRAAAIALGHGLPIDLPEGMPLVAAEATSAEVATLAERLTQRLHELGATGAHVAGEPTLTFALVRQLHRKGVACYAATTTRESTERSNSDGSVSRESVFRFVAWRRYPAD